MRSDELILHGERTGQEDSPQTMAVAGLILLGLFRIGRNCAEKGAESLSVEDVCELLDGDRELWLLRHLTGEYPCPNQKSAT